MEKKDQEYIDALLQINHHILNLYQELASSSQEKILPRIQTFFNKRNEIYASWNPNKKVIYESMDYLKKRFDLQIYDFDSIGLEGIGYQEERYRVLKFLHYKFICNSENPETIIKLSINYEQTLILFKILKEAAEKAEKQIDCFQIKKLMYSILMDSPNLEEEIVNGTINIDKYYYISSRLVTDYYNHKNYNPYGIKGIFIISDRQMYNQMFHLDLYQSNLSSYLQYLTDVLKRRPNPNSVSVKYAFALLKSFFISQQLFSFDDVSIMQGFVDASPNFIKELKESQDKVRILSLTQTND